MKALGGDLPDGSSVDTVLQPKKIFDLDKREAELLSTLDKPYTGHMAIVVPPVGASLARRLCNEPPALVITDCFNANPGGVCDSCDGHWFISHLRAS
jgi:hypothetical protein